MRHEYIVYTCLYTGHETATCIATLLHLLVTCVWFNATISKRKGSELLMELRIILRFMRENVRLVTYTYQCRVLCFKSMLNHPLGVIACD